MTNGSPSNKRRAGPRRGGERAGPSSPPPRAGDAARALAVSACARVEREGLFLDAAFEAERAQFEALSPPDRGLARALAFAYWRRRGGIEALIAERVETPPEDPAPWILRLAVAELALRPEAAHGIVDSAVRRTKAVAPRAGGLVNAVCRRIAERLAATPEAAGPSAPDWFRAALEADWGAAEAAAILAAHARGAPLDLTPDPRRTSAEALAASLDGDATPTGSVRLDARGAITALPGFDEGAWWVQDAAAALPARLAASGLAKGDRALDLCAAPGGKTLQLATAGLAVSAVDLSEARMAVVRENLARVGAEADLIVADALDWAGPSGFDAVLLDAPCSASGTVRRHPELPWLKQDWIAGAEGEGRAGAGLAGLTALQDRLLDAAWARVRPGGRLVFCTCSLFKAEGEDRSDAFFARTPDARLEPISAEELGDPSLVAVLLDAEGRLRCLPSAWPKAGGLDGFFAVRARRARG